MKCTLVQPYSANTIPHCFIEVHTLLWRAVTCRDENVARCEIRRYVQCTVRTYVTLACDIIYCHWRHVCTPFYIPLSWFLYMDVANGIIIAIFWIILKFFGMTHYAINTVHIPTAVQCLNRHHTVPALNQSINHHKCFLLCRRLPVHITWHFQCCDKMAVVAYLP